jgi:ABC-2 type transport system ATP-binding protein
MNLNHLIRVDHLSRDFSGHPAVNDISFHLQRGEVLGFLGPNGAGKTTTMNMVTGNLAPSAGEVHIAGHDLFGDPRAAKAEIGYLPENPPLYRELTVREYLRFCARINGIPRHKLASAMDAAVERCGLDEVSERLIGNLSKGYQQRVGLAQAIIHMPSVVILDEPTVGLDPIQIREIRRLIGELGKEHGVILSTHILPEVQAICDRVQIINRGRLVFSDTIEGLGHRIEHASLTVALHQPPDRQTLAELPGVEACEALEPGRFRLHFKSEHDPSEALVEQSVQQGWRLYELMPERASLEDVFVELTHDDTPPLEASA